METDNNLILSHCCWIRLLVTSMNVIHSWGIYSLGWKFDGIPGILNGIYYHLYLIGFFNGLCYELCGLLHNFMSIRLLSVLCYLLGVVGLFALMDRLLMGAYQRRSGPYSIGWFGLLQPIVDGIKLIKKESIIIQNMNILIWLISPILLFSLVLLVWSVIIYNYKVKLCDFIFSMVFQLVVNTLNVFLLCLLGWAANSNYSFIGCLRSLAQVLSYEIILNSILLIIIFSSNTWTYSELMEYQIDLNHAYGIFSLELIFIIIVVAETNRAPFDLSEAEAELVAGSNTE